MQALHHRVECIHMVQFRTELCESLRGFGRAALLAELDTRGLEVVVLGSGRVVGEGVAFVRESVEQRNATNVVKAPLAVLSPKSREACDMFDEVSRVALVTPEALRGPPRIAYAARENLRVDRNLHRTP